MSNRFQLLIYIYTHRKKKNFNFYELVLLKSVLKLRVSVIESFAFSFPQIKKPVEVCYRQTSRTSPEQMEPWDATRCLHANASVRNILFLQLGQTNKWNCLVLLVIFEVNFSLLVILKISLANRRQMQCIMVKSCWWQGNSKIKNN